MSAIICLSCAAQRQHANRTDPNSATRTSKKTRSFFPHDANGATIRINFVNAATRVSLRLSFTQRFVTFRSRPITKRCSRNYRHEKRNLNFSSLWRRLLFHSRFPLSLPRLMMFFREERRHERQTKQFPRKTIIFVFIPEM